MCECITMLISALHIRWVTWHVRWSVSHPQKLYFTCSSRKEPVVKVWDREAPLFGKTTKATGQTSYLSIQNRQIRFLLLPVGTSYWWLLAFCENDTLPTAKRLLIAQLIFQVPENSLDGMFSRFQTWNLCDSAALQSYEVKEKAFMGSSRFTLL